MAELALRLREVLDRTPAPALVEYLEQRLGLPGAGLGDRGVAGAALSPDTRALMELVAERLDVGSGTTRLEAEFQDGRLLRVHRHEKLAATALDRFDRPPDAS